MTFAPDGQARKIVIEPTTDAVSAAQGEPVRRGLTRAALEEVLAEVVPAARRGKFIGTISFLAGCSAVHTDRYERLSISRATVCVPDAQDLVRSATVTWHKH